MMFGYVMRGWYLVYPRFWGRLGLMQRSEWAGGGGSGEGLGLKWVKEPYTDNRSTSPIFLPLPRQPIPVNLKRNDLKTELSKAISSTVFIESAGTSKWVQYRFCLNQLFSFNDYPTASSHAFPVFQTTCARSPLLQLHPYRHSQPSHPFSNPRQPSLKYLKHLSSNQRWMGKHSIHWN